MGRKTIATHILEDLEDLEDVEGRYLIVYDFEQRAGETTHSVFFKNLNRILDMGDGFRVQKSVIDCRLLKTALAIRALCRHYKARDVEIYEVKGTLEAKE